MTTLAEVVSGEAALPGSRDDRFAPGSVWAAREEDYVHVAFGDGGECWNIFWGKRGKDESPHRVDPQGRSTAEVQAEALRWEELGRISYVGNVHGLVAGLHALVCGDVFARLEEWL